MTGALRERTGSLWPGVGLHVAWNAFTLGKHLFSCFKSNKVESPAPAASREICSVESLSPFNHQPVINHPSCPKENQRLINKAIKYESTAKSYKGAAEELIADAADLREQASEATEVVSTD